MKIRNISGAEFSQIDGSRQVIVDEHPRRFASLDLGERVGVYGLGWNSELGDPEVVVSADGHTVWVGVDRYLTAIEVATGRIRVAIKLHSHLQQILAVDNLTAILTETQVLVFSLDFSVLFDKALPDLSEEILLNGSQLEIKLQSGSSLVLDTQTGAIAKKVAYANNLIMFTITQEQHQKFVRWYQELEERIARVQLESKKFFNGKELSEKTLDAIRRSLEQGEPRPYYGAIGGAYMFSFTATSLGSIVKVENTATGDSIDLSDYEDW